MMRKMTAAALAACVIGAGAQDISVTHPVSERNGIHENQDWFEFRGFHYTDDKKNLPRVLLLGDSISGCYRRDVQVRLEGIANVSWFTACYCVTTPNYMKLLEFYLDDADYAVIHVNNGLHSFQADLKDYEARLAEALRMIRRKQPKAKLVWARTTPVRDAARNRHVEKLNEIADRVAKEVVVDGTDDLYDALSAVPADSRWSDGCHPKPAGTKALVKAVVTSVYRALGREIPASCSAPAEAPLEGRDLSASATVYSFPGICQKDLGTAVTVNAVEAGECVDFGAKVVRWRLEYDVNGVWTPVPGTESCKMGLRRVVRFPAVTSTKFRIVAFEAEPGCAIETFRLFKTSLSREDHTTSRCCE